MMNQVIRSLIEDLSSKKKEEDSSSDDDDGEAAVFELTKFQKELSIPLHLVYLAGLLFSSKSSSSLSPSATTPPYPEVLRGRFQEYQTVYYEYADADSGNDDAEKSTTHYTLSPRLIPTKEQQAIIDDDIMRKSKEMEDIADYVGKGLVVAEDETSGAKMTNGKKKSTTSTKKKKKHPSKSTLIRKEDDSDDGGKQRVPNETLEQLQKQIQEQTSSYLTRGSDDNYENNDDDTWITVPKKSTRNAPNKSPLPSSEEELSKEDNYYDVASLEPTTIPLPSPKSDWKEVQNDAIVCSLSDKAEERVSHNEGSSFVEVVSSPIPLCEDNESNSICQAPVASVVDGSRAETSETDQLRKRIHMLELQLAEKEELLLLERRNHAKELRVEKEKHDSHAQSMQLRLYISETRLKTYQEALDQHIQAVAANVAPNSHPVSSPLRNTSTNSMSRVINNKNDNGEQQLVNDDPTHPPSSPLISRVLQQRNRLQQDN